MIEPQYQEHKKDKMPTVEKNKVVVKVISGSWGGVKGPIQDRTPAYYFDV